MTSNATSNKPKKSNAGVTDMKIGSTGSHTDRWGSKGDSWGGDSRSREITQTYRDNWDKIFGKKVDQDLPDLVSIIDMSILNRPVIT